MENDNICCTGRMRYSENDTLLSQNLIHQNENKVIENEIILQRNDIYKEFRVNGYDYKNQFQRLKTIRTNDFKHIYGTTEWNGNFVTFLDSLLQSMLINLPFRKLMVPVMIRSIRIDPKVLFDAIRSHRVKDEIIFNENELDSDNKDDQDKKYNQISAD